MAINRWFGIGNLTRDPEQRTTKSGTAVTKFTIAIARRKKEDGTDYIPCVTYGKLAENVAKYTSKGKQVAVSGSIQTRSYDGQNGKVYVTEAICDEVQFLSKGDGGGSRQQAKQQDSDSLFPDAEDEFMPLDEEELPF